MKGELDEKDFLEEEILRDYDLQVVKKIKPCRGAYRVPTDRGVKMLKKSGCSQEELRFICYFLEHLARQGFKKTARFIFTKYGEPYIKYRGDLYYLTDWVEGRPCDLKKAGQLEEAIETLACMHKAAAGYQPPANAKGRAEWGHWESKFLERSGELATWCERGRESAGLNEFNRLFNLHAATFQRQACLALGLLDAADYQGLAQQEKAKGFVCHRDFTTRNLIRTKKRGVYVVDFDHCIQDIRIHDLSRVLCRYLPKYNWEVNVANKVISIYNSIIEIIPQELQVLLAYLTFPRKAWRLAKRYYGRTRNWTEQEAVEKLYKVINETEQREQFIRNFAAAHNISLQVQPRERSSVKDYEEDVPTVLEEESSTGTIAAGITGEIDVIAPEEKVVIPKVKPVKQTETLLKLDDDFLQGKNGWKVFKKRN